MTLLQGAIGTVNDLVDADADALVKPWKPIPSGLVEVATARRLAVGLVVAGLLLALPSGPGVLAVAVAGVVTGLLYDLRFKGTAASWVPFAIGIPLLPLYGALGAAAAGATVPVSISALCLLAVPAGAGLAIANAWADADDDAATGTASVAAALGRGRAWRISAMLTLGTGSVAALGVGVATIVATPVTLPGELIDAHLVAVGFAAIGVVELLRGAGISRPASGGRRGGSGRTRSYPRRGWETQALGLAFLALAWALALPLG